jgi:hypothetical protein
MNADWGLVLPLSSLLHGPSFLACCVQLSMEGGSGSGSSGKYAVLGFQHAAVVCSVTDLRAGASVLHILSL